MDNNYRFLVRGHLDDRWSEWLGGLSIQHTEDGCSVLTGSVPDQAALHGVIARIRDLGLPLLAVESASDRCEEPPARIEATARGSPGPTNDQLTQSTFTSDVSNLTNDTEGDIQCD